MTKCENCNIKFKASYYGAYCQWIDCEHNADLCSDCFAKCEYCKHCEPYIEGSSVSDIKEMIDDEIYKHTTRLATLNKILNKKIRLSD